MKFRRLSLVATSVIWSIEPDPCYIQVSNNGRSQHKTSKLVQKKYITNQLKKNPLQFTDIDHLDMKHYLNNDRY